MCISSVTGWSHHGENDTSRIFCLYPHHRTYRKFGPGWNNRGMTGFALLHPLFLVRWGVGVGMGGGGEGGEGGRGEGV